MHFLLSVQKDEHQYINEWFEHHLKLGFDKIVVFNNSKKPYCIQHPLYQEIDCSDDNAPQLKVYNDFYKQVSFGSTVTVLDGDEFLFSDLTIDELWRKHYTADCIRFSWQCYGDNGLVENDGRPVLERFTKPEPINCTFNKDLPDGITENFHTKYSVRKSWKPTNLNIHNPLIKFGRQVNVNGEQVNEGPWMKPLWDCAYVKHFITKSTKEFCERRLNTTDACGNVVGSFEQIKERYFNLNERTPEKEKVFDEYEK